MTTVPEAEAKATPVVLVVDDEVLVRMLACDILDDGGFRSLEAVDAPEALALIDARPDIALMFTDVDMPAKSTVWVWPTSSRCELPGCASS